MNPQPVIKDLHSESPNAASAQLRGGWLLVARVAWIILSLLIVAVIVVAFWRIYVGWSEPLLCTRPRIENQVNCLAEERALHQLGLSFNFYAVYFLVGLTIAKLPWLLVGVLIFSRKSHEMFGLFFSLMLVVWAAGQAWDEHTFETAVTMNAFLGSGTILSLIGSAGAALSVLWYLFPDGYFVPSWTRWLAIILVVREICSAFFPGTLFDSLMWPEPFSIGMILLFPVTIIYSISFRYRRVSNPAQRQQIKWIVASGSIFALVSPAQFFIVPFIKPGLSHVLFNMTYLPLLYLSGLLVAVSVGFSIFRYHLWDIDILINRALVYGSLTASVVSGYVLVVGVLGTIMQSNINWLVSIMATGLVALLVQPLRDRLQRGVNRLMYGERDDPITVLSRLGQQLETALAPDAVLPSLVETIAQRLKLPYVAIELLTQGRLESSPTTDSSSISSSAPTISAGHPQSEVIRFPLIYQSETIGQLLVAPRAPGEAFSPLDHHLLENIARQAGMAVHAVSLTNELQRARQRLVNAVEEERRRLRRDLHDGLGPALASQGLKLAAAKQLLKHDLNSVELLLDQVMMQNQETVSDVRRLVYGLRPPALDERGLVEAIRDHVVHSNDDRGSLQVDVGELPASLTSLPAAVEVAAYRITLEALTNVIRHARAQRCTIRFASMENGHPSILQIEVVDNGIGLPHELRAGVGLRSMRERAEELGGTLTAELSPHGGTRILATLPFGDFAG